MSWLYNTLVYEPLYNGLIFLIDVIPWADAGIVVIIFTLIVKLILFPLSKKALVSQLKMKKVEPELKAVREKYKNDKAEQARQTMNLYKEKGVNPFSSIFPILIQIPVIIALYQIILRSGLPAISDNLLYSFVRVPEFVNMTFLGLVDITTKNWILAIVVGVTTFVQMWFSIPNIKIDKNEKRTFQTDLQRSMNMQMKYIFPVFAVFISYNFTAAIAIYWITSNFFTIGQELFIRRRLTKQYK